MTGYDYIKGIASLIALSFYIISISAVFRYIIHRDNKTKYKESMHFFNLSFYNNILVYYPLMFFLVIGYPVYEIFTFSTNYSPSPINLISIIFECVGAICSALCVYISKKEKY